MVSMYSLRVYSEATRQALSTVALAVAFSASTRVIQLPHIQHQVRACYYLVRTIYYVVRTT